MIINSFDNYKFKKLISLKQKKIRNKENRYIVETLKLVQEAIISNCHIENIFINESFFCSNKYKRISNRDDIIIVTDRLFKKFSSLISPDGICAIIKKDEHFIYNNKMLLLDSISDPGNMGTIIRTAEAFSYNQILLYGNCADIYNEKCIRASMGSLFRLNFSYINKNEILNLKENYSIISSSLDGFDYRDLNIENNYILVLGSESHGISDEVLNLSDYKIKIPMNGKIESLNVAISAAILMSNLNL